MLNFPQVCGYIGILLLDQGPNKETLPRLIPGKIMQMYDEKMTKDPLKFETPGIDSSIRIQGKVMDLISTLPETNIAPENRWLEY